MEDNKFNFPMLGIKYVLRSTGEEVEVIDAETKSRGERSEEDWITYIDSEGKEHIKEHLNIQLDFQPVTHSIIDTLAKAASVNKFPTTRNCRIFDVAKELLIKGNIRDIDYIVKQAKELVDKVGIEIE